MASYAIEIQFYAITWLPTFARGILTPVHLLRKTSVLLIAESSAAADSASEDSFRDNSVAENNPTLAFMCFPGQAELAEWGHSCDMTFCPGSESGRSQTDHHTGRITIPHRPLVAEV